MNIIHQKSCMFSVNINKQIPKHTQIYEPICAQIININRKHAKLKSMETDRAIPATYIKLSFISVSCLRHISLGMNKS